MGMFFGNDSGENYYGFDESYNYSPISKFGAYDERESVNNNNTDDAADDE